MRLLLLATFGLMLASPISATPAFASRQAAPTPAAKAAAGVAPLVKTAMAKPAAGAARMPAAKGQAGRAQPAGFQRVGFHLAGPQPGACSRKARQCRAAGPAKAHFGWTQGLPDAAGVQANECPDGTLATLARGHEDVVRCMPI